MGVGTLVDVSLPLRVEYAGYSNNFQDGDTAGADTDCFVREATEDGTYGHDCSTGPGGSGGPLFYFVSPNHPRLVSVNTRGINGGVYLRYAAENANVAVMNQVLVNTVIEYKNKYDQ